MRLIIAALMLLISASPSSEAPAPFPKPSKVSEVTGEVTRVSESGHRDRVWITVKEKEYDISAARLTVLSGKQIAREQVCGMFMLYGVGESSIEAEIKLDRGKVISVRFRSLPERIKVMPRTED
jgi:hypothetical protein